MIEKRRIGYNFIFSLLSQVATIALGLVIPRITLLSYGSEINGLLNSVTQFVVYLTLFEAGIQAVASKALYKPVHDDSKEDINSILTAVHVNYKRTGTLYFISLIVLAFVYSLFVRSETISFVTAFFVVIFSGLGNVILFFYQGKYKILLQVEGKTYLLSNIQTLITVLTGIAKIVLLSFGYNVVLVVFTAFVINLIQAAYIGSYIRKNYDWIDVNYENPDFECLKQKNAALVHQFSSLVFQNTDVLILTIVCGLKVVSVYSLYKMVVFQITNLLNILFGSWGFALGQLYNTDKESYRRYIDVVEVYFSSLIFAIYAVTYYLLTPFITLYTRGITDIVYVDEWLPVLFVAVELLSLIRLTMLNTINYAGHFKETLSRTVTETCINLLLSVICVVYFGIYGVLFGTIAALLYRTADMIIYGNAKLLSRKPWWTFGVHAFNLVLFVLIQFAYGFLPISITSYLGFALWGAALLILTTVVFVFLNSVLHVSQAKTLMSMVKSSKD